VNNYYKINLNNVNSYINIPIEMKWDFSGRDNDIDLYQQEIAGGVIGAPNDFEVARFSHLPYGREIKTDIKYDFYFYSGSVSQVTSSTVSNWVNSYVAEGFTELEIYEFSNSFKKSFFKLDFYDTNDEKTQKNYLTVIIPTQQGAVQTTLISGFTNSVKIKKPSYTLNYIGDKEGFFVYWLRDTNYLNIDNFYVTAKFFDAKLGVFVRMMTVPQASLLGSPYGFKTQSYFYINCKLDYSTFTYQMFDLGGNRIGTTNPIKWYEYVNPT
jgi:hypothetical protein